MTSSKSQKELAFLHDLYVATDWGERFARLVDEHVKLPKEGRALYVAAGTGGHALALQERAGKKFSLICVDENAECLELARAKGKALGQQAEFRREDLTALSFPGGQFDSVLGDASLTPAIDVRQMLREMARVAKPGATVALWLATAFSFGEFFSIFWEAMHRSGLEDQSLAVQDLITELPTVSQVEEWYEREGLEELSSHTLTQEFQFESGEQFVSSPLIADFLMPKWLRPVPKAAQEQVIQKLAQIIDEERHDAKFTLSVKATLVVGKKSVRKR